MSLPGSFIRTYTVRAGQLEAVQARTLLEYVWAGIEANSGGGTAVHCPESGRKISYERLRRASENLAGWLGENCAGSLALLLPNSPESVVTALGALEAGVPLAALNPDSSPDELSRSLQEVRSPWIVTKSSLVHTALEAAKLVEKNTKQDYPIKVISIDDDVVFNGVTQLVDLLDASHQSGSARPRWSRTALVSQAWSDLGPETLLATSDSLLAGCLQSVSPHLRSGDRLASNVPFFTRYGLTSVVLNALSQGSELVILPKDGQTESLLREYQPTVASLVPSSLEGIHSVPYSIRSITVPQPLTRRAYQALPESLAGCLLQHYGPPEGPIIFSETSAGDWSRLGQPVPGTEVKVTAGGGEVGVMSEGKIFARGPQFGESDVWVPTGDTGYYDPEGTFYLTRPGNLLVDGLAVWPAELESVLCKHEGVVNAAVFSNGQSLMAAVVPSDPFQPPTSGDLRLWLLSRTAPHKQISEVFFTSSLPLASDGKVDRALLALRYASPHEYAAVSSV